MASETVLLGNCVKDRLLPYVMEYPPTPLGAHRMRILNGQFKVTLGKFRNQWNYEDMDGDDKDGSDNDDYYGT
ncbi:hypothetical protein RvY_06005 [Ramazzottius varieornatus]|uniref:Uncharacterized protein n=1 Tax=Ramazzottius varieornatus TaxID=947166 RepID=A0A1D1V002_RAMVA|nr:hypothetical protein RvY_06005 [Ramazzottius varieornatus]